MPDEKNPDQTPDQPTDYLSIERSVIHRHHRDSLAA